MYNLHLCHPTYEPCLPQLSVSMLDQLLSSECLIVAPSDAGSKLVEVGASQATITPRPTQIEVPVQR